MHFLEHLEGGIYTNSLKVVIEGKMQTMKLTTYIISYIKDFE